MAPDLRIVGEDVLFVHWPVDPAALEAVIPDGLSVDTYDSSGWVSALAHEVTAAGVDSLPLSPLPTFGEVEFRTYVTHNGEKGVHFFSCDTGQEPTSTLSKQFFSLPYHPASISFNRHDGQITVRSRRTTSPEARFDVQYRPSGGVSEAEAGSLAEFLLERHTYYAADDPDTLVAGTVQREPWQIGDVDARVRTNTLFEAIGLDSPTTEPVFHYSPRFESNLFDRERRPR